MGTVLCSYILGILRASYEKKINCTVISRNSGFASMYVIQVLSLGHEVRTECHFISAYKAKLF